MKDIFDFCQFGNLKLNSRIVRTGLWESQREKSGNFTPEIYNRYENIAASGVGLIITELISLYPRDTFSKYSHTMHYNQFVREAKDLTDQRYTQQAEFERGKAMLMEQSIPLGEYNLTLRRQVQNRHIEGTKEYAGYVAGLSEKNIMPSKMTTGVDCQALIKEFHGKGIYDPNPKDNSPREKVNAGRVIGQYWDKAAGQYVDTNWLEIVYSKRGTHIYPIRPKET